MEADMKCVITSVLIYKFGNNDDALGRNKLMEGSYECHRVCSKPMYIWELSVYKATKIQHATRNELYIKQVSRGVISLYIVIPVRTK